ncbi:hypothetical protein K2O51_23050 [Cupriavidus pinatubonensis]|uniref:hypothetical protein n=1 Tax=Cupriavidus pinatubonensis TaxID=248026 RepID=UPI001C73AADA|nr:hypothetical protein [Cupriavidus pinatubonensis]QYY30251.1 hypothetical protein K2O51_23050 [Cupriavidus pinatubonensis]
MKKPATSSSDCPVTVMIVNRMANAAWDGVSFQVVMRDARNEVVGELRELPMKYVDPKRGMVFSSVVRGTQCDKIARMSLTYFGYYPTGQGQVRVSEALVTTGLK